MNLVEKAKQFKKRANVRNEITPEMVDLAVAWAKNEVTLPQVNNVLGTTSTATYSILSRALKEHILNTSPHT